MARQLIPRAVRRSQKRARRMAAMAPNPIQLAQPVEQAVAADKAQLAPTAARRGWKQVLGIAAKTEEPAKSIEQPRPAREPALPLPAVPSAAQPSPMPAPPIAAKTQEPAKSIKPPQPAREPALPSQAAPSAAQPSQKPAPRIPGKLQKRAKPPKLAEPKKSGPEAVVDEAQPNPLDYLKDAVVEWGIKREGDEGSET